MRRNRRHMSRWLWSLVVAVATLGIPAVLAPAAGAANGVEGSVTLLDGSPLPHAAHPSIGVKACAADSAETCTPVAITSVSNGEDGTPPFARWDLSLAGGANYDLWVVNLGNTRTLGGPFTVPVPPDGNLDVGALPVEVAIVEANISNNGTPFAPDSAGVGACLQDESGPDCPSLRAQLNHYDSGTVTLALPPGTWKLRGFTQDGAVLSDELYEGVKLSSGDHPEVPYDFHTFVFPTPFVQVNPSTNLLSGQQVQVVGAGFAPNQSVSVLQCATGQVNGQPPCDVNGAAHPLTDGNGFFVTAFTVHDPMTANVTTPTQQYDCGTSGCFIVAFQSFEVLATHPLSFLLATPSPVTVSGRVHDSNGGSFSGTTGFIACPYPSIPTGSGCPGQVLTFAAPDGSFTTDPFTAGDYNVVGFTYFNGQAYGTSPLHLILNPGDHVTCDFTVVTQAGDPGDRRCGTDAPTPSGNGEPVTVQPVDPTTNTSPVTITFDDVTSPGTTTVTSSATGPAVPSGFQLGTPAVYYDVSTTATFSGSITVCFTYDPSSYPEGVGLALLHYEGGEWQPVTTTVDTDNHTICGATTSLSPFVVVAEESSFAFSGFFAPVDNPPTQNAVKAGQAVPLKFSLGGDEGLDILAAGSPSSRKVTCDSGSPVDDVETTVTASTSGLTYDAGTGQYTYVWKTDKAWAKTCRELTVQLEDGSVHTALFQLR